MSNSLMQALTKLVLQFLDGSGVSGGDVGVPGGVGGVSGGVGGMSGGVVGMSGGVGGVLGGVGGVSGGVGGGVGGVSGGVEISSGGEALGGQEVQSWLSFAAFIKMNAMNLLQICTHCISVLQLHL